jgi:signal transduction histidine kinase
MQISSNPEAKDLRVLVMTPTGRDASLICQLLDRVEIPCQSCASWEVMLKEIRAGAGAVVIAEEVLTPKVVETLSRLINDQPPWSDFPLLLLTVAGAVSASSLRRLEMQKPLGNVLMLERPIRPETLVSTVRSALRARRRQYQIREQLQQQQQSEEALRKSEKLAVAGRMAASIAHEINNPLESVTNLVYLCSTSDWLPDIRRYLAMAQEELERVSAITTHTLRFYREPTGPGPVDLIEVIDSVLMLFSSRLNYANIIVEKHCERVPCIIGLAGELRQLFANLVGNALDAMRGGGTLTLRVHRGYEWTNGRRSGVRVIIADTGQGISADKKAKIFEPFFTTKGQTGTGLGLWISSEIIQKHQGTVQVKSRVQPEKSGTVFSIFLPEKSTPQSARMPRTG